jgi:periplasmic protein TonB
MKGTVEIREPEIRKAPPKPEKPQDSLERLITAPAQFRPMFADSILQYSGQRQRQTWATAASFVVQCIMLGVLMLIPLYFTETLPKSQLLTFLIAPPPPPPPPPAEQQVARVMKQIESDLLSSGGLRTPSKIPQKVEMIKEEEAPPPMPGAGGVVGGVPGGIPGGQLGGVIGGIVNASSAFVPKLQTAVPQRVRISQGVTSGLLLRKVQPPYPALAKAARIEGSVVLKAIIDKEGNITDLQLVSGHPMLVPAAIEAVRQWKYKPYLLNGQPVEVETTVTVIFTLVG